MNTTIDTQGSEAKSVRVILPVFLVATTLVYGLRVRFKRRHRGTIDCSDWTCFIALLLDISLTAIVSVLFGHDYLDVSYGSVASIAMISYHPKSIPRLLFASKIVWIAAISSFRISILQDLVSIFSGRNFRSVCWVLLALNLTHLVGMIIPLFLVCKPFKLLFDIGPFYSHESKECWDRIESVDVGIAATNLLLNSLVVSISLRILWSLTMGKTRVVRSSALIGTAFIIILLSCLSVVRYIIWRFRHPNGSFYGLAVTALITGIEPGIGIIYACLLSIISHPLLPPSGHEDPMQSKMVETKGQYVIRSSLMQIKDELDIQEQTHESETRRQSLYAIFGQMPRQALSIDQSHEVTRSV